MSDESVVTVASPREWRRRLRKARRKHHDRSLGDALTDLYMLLWVFAVYGGALVSSVHGHLRAVASGEATGASAQTRWIVAAALLTVVGLSWKAARAVGPILSTAAEQSWGLSTPVDRRGMLAPRFGTLLLSVGLVGTVIALLGPVLAGHMTGAGWAALTGSVYGVTLAASTVLVQGGGRGSRWLRPVGNVFLALGAATAAAVVLAHYTAVALPTLTLPSMPVLDLVGLPLAMLTATAAARTLPRLSRATLGAGADVATAAVGATTLFDPSILTGVLEVRRWRGIGRVRSSSFKLGRLGRRWVLLEAEVRRLIRRPASLAIWAAFVLALYVAGMVVPSAVVTARILLGYLAAGRLMSGLRSLAQSPGRRRSLGGGEIEQRLTHVIVPAFGTIAWWALTVPAGGVHLNGPELLMVALVVAAAYRAATRPPMSYGGVVMDTPLGLVPIELLFQLARGPDLLAAVFIVHLVAH